MAEVLDYLKQLVADGASDLFIVSGGPVSEKRDKKVYPISEGKIFREESERLISQIYDLAKRQPMEEYVKKMDDDFSFAVNGVARFRVNVYHQRGSLSAVVRAVPFEIPDWQALQIPRQVMDLADVKNGLVLITGTAGSGKSTTQACIIDRINRTKEFHIITLEDPIEFLHRTRNAEIEREDDPKSIISQREINIDTTDYSTALRGCLRQAPDVILLGEMRDAETIQTAMTAAETGHLVISTLHTRGAASTVNRIVQSFPAEQQKEIRMQLSMALHTVVSQRLLPGVSGGLVPAFEIMNANESSAVKSIIEKGEIDDLIQPIGSNDYGMISMDQSILRLVEKGEITKETAMDFAEDKAEMAYQLGIPVDWN